ncbi:MAG: trigger factor [Deltaproteobacteria bacterium]|nr:trigger factor [Deltaproteobacteria bacterium]
MKFTVEDTSAVKKVLHIEIPQNEVVDEIESAYKELNKTAKIKGFRPGKAPRSVLERLYKKDVYEDVTSRLIKNSFAEAISESGLSPLRLPDIDPPKISADSAYLYSATVEINPEIPDIGFKGLTLKKSLYKPSDDELEAQLKMLQKNLSERKPIEPARASQEGDFVILDYEGFRDGVPHPDLQKTENMTLKIGTSKISKDFDAQIVGMMPGDQKDFSIKFPEDYHNASLAGQEATFHVHIHEIREEILPEINDDFAKRLGSFNSIEDVKTAIQGNLLQGYNKRAEQEINEQIFSALIKKAPFEVPDTLIDWELSGIIREIERSFEHQQVKMDSLGMTHESLAATYRDTAEKQVRRHLILGKIISQEKLTLPEADLTKALQEMAASYGRPVDEIKSYYDKHPDDLAFFKHTLLEKQAIRLIIDNNTVEEIEPVLEDHSASLPEK